MFEQGEKPTRYFFNLEKRNCQNKLWQRIQGSDGQFKYDIDSILDEQIKFCSKLFTSEGGDKNSGDDLLSFVQQILTDVEKNETEEDLTIEEIKKTVMSIKSLKSPGGDRIISVFYQLYWEAIEKDFFEVVNEVFHNFELTDSQYNGMITLLHKSGNRDNICNWKPITLLNTDYKII